MPRGKRFNQQMTNHEIKEATDIKPIPRWKKTPLAYEYNYGYAMNYYQPMIDYIDAKERGKKPPIPHLPYANERGLEQYRPSNHVHAYSAREMKGFEVKAEERANERMKNTTQISGTTSSRTSYGLSKSYSAASVTKQVFTQMKKSSREQKVSFDDSTVKRAYSLDNLRSQRELSAELSDSMHNLNVQRAYRAISPCHDSIAHGDLMVSRRHDDLKTRQDLKSEFRQLDRKTHEYLEEKSKQTSIEIEQLNSRVVEAETKLKTEVMRIKKKLQITITELEMSLDVANKSNIDLQKTCKKQSLQLTEIQAHYEEIHRQLQVTVDQYGVAQRRILSLTSELDEIRGNYEQSLRIKRAVEQQYEDATTRINELTTINVNLSSSRSKLETELSTLASDYDEVTKELRIADERYQRVQIELKHSVETLHEEQERVIKIETIKKSLEIECKNLSIRLEEVEANALVGGKRVITKLEARIRDIELELDEEKRRHAETIKILRKKERTVKEVMMQCEEDQKNVSLLQDAYDKVIAKVNIYKRQVQETEGMSQQSVTRVRRFQRELEAAEDRADTAESSLSLIRAKHRTFVTTSSVPGSQVYLVQESTRSSSAEYN